MNTDNDIRLIRLQNAFRNSGMSQKELCAKTGITTGALSSYLSGRYFPKQNTLSKIAAGLGVSLSYLMGLDESADNAPKNQGNIYTYQARAVPILGDISSTGASRVSDNSNAYYIDNSIPADYAVRVPDDSMTGAGMNKGDLAFIRKTTEIIDGGVYAVALHNSAVIHIKTVNTRGDLVVLTPANSSYDLIMTTRKEVYIIGEVLGVYHPLSQAVTL